MRGTAMYGKGRIRMAVVEELICTEENGTLSFGNDSLAEKTKKTDYEFEGDLYKVKTFVDITKLERNGMFVYESVPGTNVFGFYMTGSEASFKVSGHGNTQITLEMESSSEYEVYIDGECLGIVRTNLGGKLTFSLALDSDREASVEIHKW